MDFNWTVSFFIKGLCDCKLGISEKVQANKYKWLFFSLYLFPLRLLYMVFHQLGSLLVSLLAGYPLVHSQNLLKEFAQAPPWERV
ncbi:hypothetical protein OIU85_015769 [Salix viminalis]|uniref:Uncharacterized protein n=1 Tax=Salix viminalis TaxID=40686 RepID=A0A9Q0ZP31_SALVM|nr:hypothetical protein OIU85_015769 [Salix viminalis]